MTHPLARAVLVLWAATLAVALLVVLRGCAESPVVTVRVEMRPLEFVEKQNGD